MAPFPFGLLSLLARLKKMRARRFGDVERRIHRPAEVLLGQSDLFHAERRTVRFERVLLVGRPITEMRPHQD